MGMHGEECLFYVGNRLCVDNISLENDNLLIKKPNWKECIYGVEEW